MITTEVSKKRRFMKTKVCSVLLPSDASRFYNVAKLKDLTGKSHDLKNYPMSAGQG